ncbi:MAG: peptidyl-prolyl cis-trans isomerase, partial [Alphaproteobacteria bacterium]
MMLGLGLLVWTLLPASAQDMRAAAVVNDEIISMLDVTMRLRLAILSSGAENTPEMRRRILPQIMRRLIDERLQAQEAKRLNIEVSEAQIDKAIARIAGQNNMTPDEFLDNLRRNGVYPEALRDQIRAQITWQMLIARRLRPNVQISDDEVEE